MPESSKEVDGESSVESSANGNIGADGPAELDELVGPAGWWSGSSSNRTFFSLVAMMDSSCICSSSSALIVVRFSCVCRRLTS